MFANRINSLLCNIKRRWTASGPRSEDILQSKRCACHLLLIIRKLIWLAATAWHRSRNFSKFSACTNFIRWIWRMWKICSSTMGMCSAIMHFDYSPELNSHHKNVCFRNALDLLPTTVFPNFPPGGHIDDENNQRAIEALKNAKEYTIVNEEDTIQQESILSKYKKSSNSLNAGWVHESTEHS